MKKVSTAAAKQTKNLSQSKLTIGLDLGDRWSWYCVLDETGEVLLEQKLGTTPKAMREGFGALPRCRIALETGMHSPWVSRLLSELGHEVIVAHARNMRLIGESRGLEETVWSGSPGPAQSQCPWATPGSWARSADFITASGSSRCWSACRRALPLGPCRWWRRRVR